MDKKHFFIALFTVPIILLLLVASIWGENGRAEDIVNNYLANLESGDFTSQCIPVITPKPHGDTTLSCEDQNFLFMASLVSTLSLRELQSNLVKTELNSVWFPFVTDNSVTVGLSFTTGTDEYEFKNLFVLERNGWSWAIKEIDVASSSLLKQYTTLRETVDLNKFIVSRPNGLEIKKTEILPTNLAHIDKMLLKYNLEKVIKSLE